MSKDVKGVFVRLPLSDEQITKLYNPKKSGNENLLAIGTPVTGRELEVVCSIDEDILCDISELDDDDEEYVTDMVFKPNPEGVNTAPLVRQSDALAKLAEKDAEIARLRGALAEISSVAEVKKYTETYSAINFCENTAKSALKGPEA